MQEHRTTRMATARPDDKKQSERFVETAKEIGADEKGSEADGLMGRLVKQPRDPKKAKNAIRRR